MRGIRIDAVYSVRRGSAVATRRGSFDARIRGLKPTATGMRRYATQGRTAADEALQGVPFSRLMGNALGKRSRNRFQGCWFLLVFTQSSPDASGQPWAE